MRRSKTPRVVLIVCRILFGLTFLFSGVVKAIDPMGTAYKINDYLIAFGLEGLTPISTVAAFVLITLEFCIGLCMFFGWFMKTISRVAAIFMAIMTLVTLWLAIFNPVSDCGCFGDAIKLTNWQTFYKNAALDVLLILIFVCLPSYRPFLQPAPTLLLLIIGAVIILSIQIHCYRHLPIVDFRPYKEGNNIVELMQVPEGMPTDKYDIKFIYEKDGRQREFTLEDYPADDSTWVFVEQKAVLIEKGYEPPIHDFSLTLSDMGDITDLVLGNPGYTFLLISTKLEDFSIKSLDKVKFVYAVAKPNGIPFYCMTSSSDDQIEEFKELYNIDFPIATSDETMLKTVIRSNPGLVLLKNGTVVKKWHYNDLPDDKEIISIIKQ